MSDESTSDKSESQSKIESQPRPSQETLHLNSEASAQTEKKSESQLNVSQATDKPPSTTSLSVKSKTELQPKVSEELQHRKSSASVTLEKKDETDWSDSQICDSTTCSWFEGKSETQPIYSEETVLPKSITYLSEEGRSELSNLSSDICDCLPTTETERYEEQSTFSQESQICNLACLSVETRTELASYYSQICDSTTCLSMYRSELQPNVTQICSSSTSGERSDLPCFSLESRPCHSTSSLSVAEGSAALSIGPSQDIDISPFRMMWIFGVNPKVNVINLTVKSRPLVFYACTHVASLYDYEENRMYILQGHKNHITSISTNSSGRWLVTADEGEDNSILVWDSFECLPVNTIFDPHPKCGTQLCAISENAKYLISIGKENKPTINFWLWTYGNNEPDDTYTVTGNYGLARKICFNLDVQEHIWIAFQKKVLFMEWDAENKKLTAPVIPTIRNIKKYGLITDCTYFLKCHQCVASTSGGVLLVFGNTVYRQGFEESELMNNKIYVKPIKISTESITCIESVDGLLVTGDDKGRIKFFDEQLKILFWCQNFELESISSISFNLEKRNYVVMDPNQSIDPVISHVTYDSDECEYTDDDRSRSTEILYKNLLPTDATVDRLPFVVRDFIVATTEGRIGVVNYIKNTIKFLARKFNADITSIDTHDVHPFICMALSNSVIYLYDFAEKKLIAETTLTNETQGRITYIKYSPKGLHLACATSTGNLIFLDPITLTTKFGEPISVVFTDILKVVFSIDSKLCAYYTNDSTIVILKFLVEIDEWEVLAKMKSHYKSINDVLFTPYLPARLFSIGSDRMLQEYDLKNSCNYEMVLKASERIEQCAIPIAFIYHPSLENSSPMYFYMCDNEYKFKMVSDTTFMCHRIVVGPAYGCYEKSPVDKIQILPEHDNKYLIYANDNHIGIHMFPPDGNPHKYVGTTGHPTKLLQFRTSYDGKYVFTIGEGDNCVLMWEVNVEAVETVYENGGVELEPYFCLVEGGLHGWLFREMQDLFYYMQILHQGENTVLPRTVSDCIPVSELPDLMRAVGFYPSEYEIENMLIDIKYRDFDETKVLKDDVSFLEFVQLYVNYRPPHGITIEKLKEQFDFLCFSEDSSEQETISRDGFVQAICERGETFSINKAYTCLATLMREETETQGDFTFLPSVIDFKTFLEDILGIDLERETIIETGDKESVEEEIEC